MYSQNKEKRESYHVACKREGVQKDKESASQGWPGPAEGLPLNEPFGTGQQVGDVAGV